MCTHFVKQFEICGHALTLRTVPCIDAGNCPQEYIWHGTIAGHCSKVECTTPPPTDASDDGAGAVPPPPPPPPPGSPPWDHNVDSDAEWTSPEDAHVHVPNSDGSSFAASPIDWGSDEDDNAEQVDAVNNIGLQSPPQSVPSAAPSSNASTHGANDADNEDNAD